MYKDRRDYFKRYIAEHPERRLQWRITAASNLLQRQGWQLIPPAATCEEV